MSNFSLSAVKIGMLATGANVEAVSAFIREYRDLPAVLDPVLRASAGAPLLDEEGLRNLQQELLPDVALATPNLDEAAILLGEKIAPENIPELPLRLFEKYGCNVLVKGGHEPAKRAVLVDRAIIDGEIVEFEHPRLDVGDTHGTGCTLSSAIAAYLARGLPMREAIERGIAYLTATLEHSLRWTSPRATEALNHFPDNVDSQRP